MIMPYKDKRPVLGDNVYIAPTAVVIGDVTIKENASVWFNAVIRGDMAPITIGRGTNIQDNCTLHTDPGCPVTIGAGVTVGHNAVVHGCTIEDNVLIGMHAVILNNALIRSGSVVAAGAVVKEQQQIGPFKLVAGMPAKSKKSLDSNASTGIQLSAEHYRELAAVYARADSH